MKTKIIICSLFTLFSCAHKQERDPKQSTFKVLYGDDDRENVIDIKNPKILNLAKSTAGMVKKKYIENGQLEPRSTFSEAHDLCPRETFEDEPVGPSCTGFLIAPDVLATAGHCVENQRDCERNVWIFDLKLNQVGDRFERLSNNQIYNCKEIISQKKDYQIDYALLRLDRKVTGRRPLPFRKKREGRLSDKTKLMAIGHPSGLASKVTSNGTLKENTGAIKFKAFIDTYGGNSGSPIFDQDRGVVEGILVSGERDFEIDRERYCYRSKRCPPTGCSGESIVRITAVPKLEEIVRKSGGAPTIRAVSPPLRNGKITWEGGTSKYITIYRNDVMEDVALTAKDPNGEKIYYRKKKSTCSFRVNDKRKGESLVLYSNNVYPATESNCVVEVEGGTSKDRRRFSKSSVKKVNIKIKDDPTGPTSNSGSQLSWKGPEEEKHKIVKGLSRTHLIFELQEEDYSSRVKFSISKNSCTGISISERAFGRLFLVIVGKVASSYRKDRCSITLSASKSTSSYYNYSDTRKKVVFEFINRWGIGLDTRKMKLNVSKSAEKTYLALNVPSSIPQSKISKTIFFGIGHSGRVEKSWMDEKAPFRIRSNLKFPNYKASVYLINGAVISTD